MGKRLQLLQENIRLSHIAANDREGISKIVQSYHDIFTLEGDPLPCTDLARHQIIVKDERPINNASYRPLECHQIKINRQVTDMLDKRVISISKSPFNSPLWVVPKKADASEKQKWRIVIDFRNFNERTDQDAYPLPIIDDILDHLGKAKFFSVFDLFSGFHQIPMDPES